MKGTQWHLVVPISLAALAVVCGVALAASRHVRPGCGLHGHGALGEFAASRLEHVLDELEATESQRARARVILERHARDVAALRTGREEAHREIAGLWSAESLDAAALRGVIDRRIEEARAAGHRLADAAAEFHAILTPGQREQLAEMAAERHARWHSRR